MMTTVAVSLLALQAWVAAGAGCTSKKWTANQAPSLVQLRINSVDTFESLDEEGIAEEVLSQHGKRSKRWYWPWESSGKQTALSPTLRSATTFHFKELKKKNVVKSNVTRDPNRPYFCVEDGAASAVEGTIQYLLTPWLFNQIEHRINSSNNGSNMSNATVNLTCMCSVQYPYCYPDDSICYKSNISRENTKDVCYDKKVWQKGNCTSDFDANLSKATSTSRTVVNSAAGSAMCMAVAGKSYDENASVTALVCDGSDSMRWTWHEAAGGGTAKQLVNDRSFMCLDTVNDSNMTQRPCAMWNESFPNQEWSTVGKQLYHQKTGKCVTFNSSSFWLKDCANSDDQQWNEVEASASAALLDALSDVVVPPSAASALQSLLATRLKRSPLAAAALLDEVLELLRRPTFADAIRKVNLTQNLTNKSRELVSNATYTTLATLIGNECSTTTTTTTTTTGAATTAAVATNATTTAAATDATTTVTANTTTR